MNEKKKRKKLNKKQKELINFAILCFLIDLTWYICLTNESILWMILLPWYSAWVCLSGARIICAEKKPDIDQEERFQAEIVNSMQTIYPDIHKMKAFMGLDLAEKWADETVGQSETWRIIDLHTGLELRKQKKPN